MDAFDSIGLTYDAPGRKLSLDLPDLDGSAETLLYHST